MASLDYFNYWADKIAFKEKIEDELYPILEKYVGKELTKEVAFDIKKDITDWLVDINEVVFDCDITIDIDKQDKDIIKSINVNPRDII